MGVYKRTRSTFWWYRFAYSGQEYRGTTGQTDKRLAQKAERRVRAAIEVKPRKRQTRTFGLAEVGVLDLERAAAAKNSPGEQETLRGRWRAMCRILGADFPPARIGGAELHHLATTLAAKQRGQTVRKHMMALKRGLTLAKRQGWILDLPEDWPVIKNDPRNEQQAGKVHPPEVVRAWLQSLTPDARDEATLVLLTGLRWGEIKRLTASWVQLAPPNSAVTYAIHMPAAATKARTARVVPIPDAAFQVIRRRARIVGSETAVLFPTKSHKGTYHAAARRIGYDRRITLRDLRHTFATQADWLGGDRRSAQEMLGHTTEAMTGRYLHSTAERLGAVADAVGRWAEGAILGTLTTAHQEKDEQ